MRIVAGLLLFNPVANYSHQVVSLLSPSSYVTRKFAMLCLGQDRSNH